MWYERSSEWQLLYRGSVDVQFDLHKVFLRALSGPVIVIEAAILPA